MTRRTPISNEYTNDMDLYFREWDSLIDPIKRVTGWIPHGLDPGASFITNEGPNGFIQFSLSQLKQISAICEELEILRGK